MIWFRFPATRPNTPLVSPPSPTQPTATGRFRRLTRAVAGFGLLPGLLGMMIGLAMSPPAAAAEPSPQEVSITLVYTSDIRGEIDPCGCQSHPRGGLAPRATYFDGIWDEKLELITLDAGDLFGKRSNRERNQTRFLCEQTASFGYDAIGLGEHDLNYGLAFLQQMMRDYQLPFTNANVHDADTGELILPESILVERGGIRFGIVSVLDPQQEIASLTRPAPAVRVDDPVSTLNEIVPRLHESCDAIILLSHLGDEGTLSALRQVPGIDVAVVGHTYRNYKTERRVGDTVVLTAVYEGRVIGRADLRMEAGSGKIRDAAVQLTSLDAKIEDDPDMAAAVASFKEQEARSRADERARWPRDRGAAQEAFLGRDNCRTCHGEVYASWSKTTHAQAYKTLQSVGMEAEPQCLACHTTGYRYLGGYEDSGVRKRLTGVQCEACHGYGSEHSRGGGWSDQALNTCTECHDNSIRPCFDASRDSEFRLPSAWEQVKHGDR